MFSPRDIIQYFFYNNIFYNEKYLLELVDYDPKKLFERF